LVERASGAPWVLKLGGSLFNGPHLRQWLDSLASQGGGIVIVPGGGPFADQVRSAQARWDFGDEAGHRMAMLGMAQFGLMLADLQPAFAPAGDLPDIQKALAHGQVALWLPTGREHLDVPRNWSVTSDSLAAWLAARLGATRLLLIKSMRLDETQARAAELARRGVVDDAFPTVLSWTRTPCLILGAADYPALAGVLEGRSEAGCVVTA
jgi:aspartokinase-like uncharacterized kinase